MDAGLANLLASSLVLGTALAVPRLRPGWPVWLRMAVRLAAFAGLTALLEHGSGSPLAPRLDTAEPGRQVWQQVLEAGWWLLAGRVAVGAVRLFVVLKSRPRETRILADLLSGTIYVATGLAVVAFAFSVPLGGLLATSGVVAIVLGLALQSTLSDVFSGIAVGLERPYAAGDHVWLEGGIEGQVLEVNWRSTRIATPERNVATVPNSVVAKARLVNRSAPTAQRRDTLEVRLDSRVEPEHCIAALRAAVAGCGTVLDDPAPSVLCTGLAGDGASYRIGFSVAGSALLLRARSQLLVLVHRHLRHAGIVLAVPGKAHPKPVAAPGLPELLAGSELFGVFAAADRDVLARFFRPARVEEGTVLLGLGETPDALLLIAAGTLGTAVVGADGVPRVVNRLGPGETLGAAGLITGQPFTATATALTPMDVWRLQEDDLAAGLAENPDLSSSLHALAERVVTSMRREAVRDEDGRPAPPTAADAFRNFVQMLRLRTPPARTG